MLMQQKTNRVASVLVLRRFFGRHPVKPLWARVSTGHGLDLQISI
jgi:hypothetical protein